MTFAKAAKISLLYNKTVSIDMKCFGTVNLIVLTSAAKTVCVSQVEANY